ncbi:MAG: hypothetical protein ABI323_03975 [Solirubrobacteraceae bacterium]
MLTEPSPLSLAQAVRRAVEVVDPDDGDPQVGEYEQAFEDADEVEADPEELIRLVPRFALGARGTQMRQAL